MNKHTNTHSETKPETHELSEKFLEYMDTVILDDDETEYPEYDDVPSSF